MTSQNQSFTLQSGVLAFYKSKICLVSTPKLRKWVIPKGNIPTHMGPADSALKECYEEAGLIGYLRPAPLGSYEFYKSAEIASLVLVYELMVTQVLDSWPESNSRSRIFATFDDAVSLIELPSLQLLIQNIGESRGMLSQHKPQTTEKSAQQTSSLSSYNDSNLDSDLDLDSKMRSLNSFSLSEQTSILENASYFEKKSIKPRPFLSISKNLMRKSK